MRIRLHKYLADHGVASRRKCEEYILKGLVKVNGKTVKEMGVKIDPEHSKIEVHPSLKLRQERFVYYMLHKPVGYVCSVSGPEQPKITELLKDIPERVFPVGRLDKLTSGLLLITNDGRFAYEMTHPKFEKEKEYVVKVREKLTQRVLQTLSKSIYVRGRKTQKANVKMQSNHLFCVILKEGRNRQIRRLAAAAGLSIEKLKRIRIGTLTLGNLSSGRYRELKQSEIRVLLRSGGGG